MITIKQEIKVTKAIGDILLKPTEIDINTPMPEKEVGLMDCANVCMIIAKSPSAERLLNRFKELNGEWAKVPELEYTSTMVSKCKYSTEYVRKIIKIFVAYDSNPTYYVRNHYPLTIEDKHFKIILAPRVTE